MTGLICVNRDIYGLLLLRELREGLTGSDSLIVYSDNVLRRNRRDFRLEALHFVEQVFPCELSVFDGVSPILADAFREVEGEISGEPPLSVRSSQELDALVAMRPFHHAISLRFGVRFSSFVVATIPRIMNLHSGVLPEFRGVMPTFWAMYQRKATSGVTLHQIADNSLDTGPIIQATETAIDYARPFLENLLNVYRDGVRQLGSMRPYLSGSNVDVVTQDEAKARYFSFPNSTELAEFEARGGTLFSFSDLEQVYRKLI